jgi:hypothetical protein
MPQTESNGFLRVAVVLSAVLLIWNLATISWNYHPVLFTLAAVFNAMFLPAFALHSRMREGWLLPGVASAMSAVDALKETLRPGVGSHWMLRIEIPFCAFCAIFSVVEGIRALKRHQRERRPPEPNASSLADL